MAADRMPRWLRLTTIGILAALATSIMRVQVENVLQPQSMDFLSFWAAARLVVAGTASAAYDLAAHRAVQLTLIRFDDLLPFTYPPHVLALLAPLGLVPYRVALVSWTLLGVATWGLSSRRLGAGSVPLASAAAFTNVLGGQNGFFLASLFVLAADQTRTRPWLAGLFWALLASKPQLAALVPLALLAGRLWTSFLAAGLIYAGLLAGAAGLFGPDIYLRFFASALRFSGWLRAGEWDWTTMTSIYALCRLGGLSHAPALVVHGLVALGGAAAVIHAWRRELACKTAILAAASLLVSPYLFSYDALLIAVPIAFLATTSEKPWAMLAIWLPSFLIVGHLAGIYAGPNPIGLLAVASIVLCLSRERAVRPAAA